MFLSSVEEVRKITYSHTSQWDIKFEGTPGKFGQWFPAHSVTYDRGDIRVYEPELFLFSIGVPSTMGARNLSIQFYDDESNSLSEWLATWYEEVFPENRYVATISEIVRTVHIAKLNRTRELIRLDVLKVFPVGKFSFGGDSEGKLETLDQNFRIVSAPGSASLSNDTQTE